MKLLQKASCSRYRLWVLICQNRIILTTWSCTSVYSLPWAFPAFASSLPTQTYDISVHTSWRAVSDWVQAARLLVVDHCSASFPSYVHCGLWLSFHVVPQRFTASFAHRLHELQRAATQTICGHEDAAPAAVWAHTDTHGVSICDSVSDPLEVTVLLVDFILSCNIFITSSWFNSSDLPLGF